MKFTSVLAGAAALALASSMNPSYADDAHHPEAASVPPKAKAAPARPAPKKTPKAGKAQTEKLDAQLHEMRSMHEKMANAKTVEERNALMDDHMKAMRGGMAMMNGMMGRQGGKESQSPEMMQKQMDMMDMMKDMMKDRMNAQGGGMNSQPPGK